MILGNKMPIHEYQCGKCGRTFEVLLRSRADSPKQCPKCGAPGPEKIFSVFSATVAKKEAPCASGACAPHKCAGGACPFG